MANMLLVSCGGDSNSSSVEYPSSSATYDEVNDEVGGRSTYSEQKIIDVFNSKYKNHWVTWEGNIYQVDGGELSLDFDGGLSDVIIKLVDKNAGYDLNKGDIIKVQFLLTSLGDEYFAFEGEYGRIVK